MNCTLQWLRYHGLTLDRRYTGHAWMCLRMYTHMNARVCMPHMNAYMCMRVCMHVFLFVVYCWVLVVLRLHAVNKAWVDRWHYNHLKSTFILLATKDFNLCNIPYTTSITKTLPCNGGIKKRYLHTLMLFH